MAKFVTSALIDEIKGKFNGDVFQTWKGIVVRRRGTFPRNPRSAIQQKGRGYFGQLSGQYDGLSSSQKTGWVHYAACSSPFSGFNAFMKLNQRLVYADTVGLTQINDAPADPSSPVPVVGATLSYSAGADEWLFGWSTPAGSTLFIQAFYSIMTGYRDNLFPMWKLSETKRSDLGDISISASDYDSGRFIRVRARVIDQNGEVSAWTETLEAAKS